MNPLPLQYVLEVRHKGYGIQAGVNGIELARNVDPDAITFGARLNVWLRKGNNVVTIRFQPLQDGGVARVTISAESSAVVESVVFDSGETGGRAVEHVISIRESSGSALETATPAPIEANRQPFLLIEELHTALLAKNADRVIELQRIQVEEQAIAVGMSGAAALAEYRAFLNDMWSEKEWRVLPFDRTRLRLERTEIGNLYHVMTPGGDPPIRTSNGDMRFSIDPYVAYVGGRWRIVR